MQRTLIGRLIQSDGGNIQFAASARDADCDFAAIGDENFVKQGSK